jgi:methionyl-tRNA synthetase
MDRFHQWWPADLHVIGKDITRFHCALWPAMCMAAGIAPPKKVFGHGFVYIKSGQETVKISKSLGTLVEPMDILRKFSAEAFRYYFLRECPFPGDGEFSWKRFADLYNSDLANNLGNLYSRVTGLIGRNFNAVLDGTAGRTPVLPVGELSRAEVVSKFRHQVESLQYNQALATLWQGVLVPANQHAEKMAPWSLVKTDKPAAALVLHDLVEAIRVAAILLKPFLPKLAETLYQGFNFDKPFEAVATADALDSTVLTADTKVVADLVGGKVAPLFPRIEIEAGE